MLSIPSSLRRLFTIITPTQSIFLGAKLILLLSLPHPIVEEKKDVDFLPLDLVRWPTRTTSIDPPSSCVPSIEQPLVNWLGIVAYISSVGLCVSLIFRVKCRPLSLWLYPRAEIGMLCAVVYLTNLPNLVLRPSCVSHFLAANLSHAFHILQTTCGLLASIVAESYYGRYTVNLNDILLFASSHASWIVLRTPLCRLRRQILATSVGSRLLAIFFILPTFLDLWCNPLSQELTLTLLYGLSWRIGRSAPYQELMSVDWDPELISLLVAPIMIYLFLHVTHLATTSFVRLIHATISTIWSGPFECFVLVIHTMAVAGCCVLSMVPRLVLWMVAYIVYMPYLHILCGIWLPRSIRQPAIDALSDNVALWIAAQFHCILHPNVKTGLLWQHISWLRLLLAVGPPIFCFVYCEAAITVRKLKRLWGLLVRH
ncbi:hypothetical protein MIND_00666100 [Mycena indigotica]|uniref:Uncharacterized protein n=1 Tax=Mycena indigotica TaxID=2126181 RepID=A0A8H6W445_9AGAR|nr:uncharacterized protein MIND_00666100 [Mycena indigotica]KAF7301023.1 hypothetical protein MIND_00666100 [Mycena indigotica]